MPSSEIAFQRCLNTACGSTFSISEVLTRCSRCGDLLDVDYDWSRARVPGSLREFETRWSERLNPLSYSGVWRFRELLPFAPDEQIVTIGEGQTQLKSSNAVARYCDLPEGTVLLQYEGLNPSGSFKDNGMTAASTHARMTGAKQAACASTGNTSASLAIYGGTSGLFGVVVFVGSGKISYGKLSQALDYGALTVQIRGDFDDAMRQVQAVCQREGIYLCNSVNPFRLEGQKTIIYRILESLGWEVPDWIVVPGGNLGNSSSFGKALSELKQLGLIQKLPRLAVINAAGSDTLYELYERRGLRWNGGQVDQALIDGFYAELDASGKRAETLATAIQISRPVNLKKALRALDVCDGVVRRVTDQEILDAKAQIGAGGFGCEPASAASVAGARLLRREGTISPGERVICILTGHQLKDPTATVAYHAGDAHSRDDLLKHGVERTPFANRPVAVANEIEEILRAVRAGSVG
ncbi:MAG: threonine synthase [Planctomycetota bacterium]|nr:threonine synthase [Planctomycetota bacterium]